MRKNILRVYVYRLNYMLERWQSYTFLFQLNQAYNIFFFLTLKAFLGIPSLKKIGKTPKNKYCRKSQIVDFCSWFSRDDGKIYTNLMSYFILNTWNIWIYNQETKNKTLSSLFISASQHFTKLIKSKLLYNGDTFCKNSNLSIYNK
jgi:hypothetical protein